MSKPRSPEIGVFIGSLLLWWSLTAFIYHQTESNFLRAESGWYLFLSHSAPAKQHEAEMNLLTKSFNGHYTPFAFLAEFTTAKFIGTNAGFWKWRQITVVALLATMLFLVVRNSGNILHLSRVRASLSAVGLTAILIFQPQMREFIAWPYMIMQLLWLLFTVIGLLSLIEMVCRPSEALWPWLAALSSYTSLHFLGLGIATVTSTAAVLAGTWLATRRRSSSDASKIVVPLLSLIALTTLHAIIMVKFPLEKPVVSSIEWQTTSFVTASLGFIPNLAVATALSLFGAGQPTTTAEQISQDWFLGLMMLLCVGFLVSSAFLRSLKEPTAHNRVRFVLRSFASISFLSIIVLTSARVWREPDSGGFADYLTGSRYLIPSTFAVAGVMAELVLIFSSERILFNAIWNLGLLGCAMTANLYWAVNVYPKISSRAMISHARGWQAIVAMASECQRADLAIPNVPLDALTEFDGWDLKLFEPLLRADLKSPPGTNLQFTEWADLPSELPNDYDRNVPALREVRKRLQL